MSLNSFRIESLGQTGLKINFNNLCLIIDPYLSNSVEELDGPDFIRQVPIPYQPEDLDTVDWAFITHDHIDHCDPKTIPALAEASPNAMFVGPLSVRKKLLAWGVSKERILSSSADPLDLGQGISIRAIPSAHPTIHFDQYGQPACVGYLISSNSKSIYIAGDTSVCDHLISTLKDFSCIDYAFLPVNEDNYFRRKRGIVGNMSIRDAFGLAAEVGIRNVIPVHWDMFSLNSSSPQEILSVYTSKNWPFNLLKTHDVEL